VKKCKKCGVEFEGRVCKPCASAYMREWAAKNADKVKESKRKTYLKHKRSDNIRSKSWAEKNRERSNAIKKAYKERNREAYLAQQREYARKRYLENREEILEKENSPERKIILGEWREKNRERLNKKYLEVYHTDPDQKKKHQVRAIVNKAIKAGKIVKPICCSVCQKTGRIEGHHEDYDKPLEVIWLCRKCHGNLHSKYSKVGLQLEEVK